MRLFFEWLNENTNSLVTIDLSKYNKRANAKATELLRYAQEKKQKLNNFRLDINLIKTGLKDFPLINQLLVSLKNKDGVNWVIDKKMFPWHSEITKDMNFEERQLIFKALRHLLDYYDSIEDREIDEKEYYEPIKKSIEETNKNMQVVKSKIEQSINDLSWNGSKVTIIPEMPDSDEEYLPSATGATVLVGNKSGIFTYFDMGQDKIQIEDILELDNDSDDYFSNNEEKQDYFNLISQLQNPNKKDKILTLYTARPVKDREFYSKTNYLPAGVFLSNSFDHVDGLAGDLAGTEDRRDIYKVKINSKYLLKTLDGPVQYYQASKDAPVVSINLY